MNIENNSNLNNDNVYNQEQVSSTKKKGPNVVLIIVLILILVGVGFGSFKLGSIYANKEEKSSGNENNNVVSNDETNEIVDVAKPAKNEKYTFIEEQTREIEYSGSKHQLLIYFYLDNEKFESREGDLDKYFYVLRRDVFIDGKYIIDSEKYRLFENEDDAKSNIPSIDNINVNILKDTTNSDEYLIFDGQIEHWTYIKGGLYKYSVIVDECGSVLGTIESQMPFTGVHGILVNDSMIGDRNYVKYTGDGYFESNDGEYLIYSNSLMDIHSDFIYYIIMNGGNNYAFRELKLSISNGLISKSEVAVYSWDRASVAGQS